MNYDENRGKQRFSSFSYFLSSVLIVVYYRAYRYICSSKKEDYVITEI